MNRENISATDITFWNTSLPPQCYFLSPFFLDPRPTTPFRVTYFLSGRLFWYSWKLIAPSKNALVIFNFKMKIASAKNTLLMSSTIESLKTIELSEFSILINNETSRWFLNNVEQFTHHQEQVNFNKVGETKKSSHHWITETAKSAPRKYFGRGRFFLTKNSQTFIEFFKDIIAACQLLKISYLK